MVKSRPNIATLPRVRGRVMRGWSDGKFDPRASLGPLAPEVSRLLRSMEREGQVFGSPAGTTRLADSQWPVDAQGRPLTRWNQALSPIFCG